MFIAILFIIVKTRNDQMSINSKKITTHTHTHNGIVYDNEE